MDTHDTKALATVPIVVFVAAMVAAAGSHAGVTTGGVPVFAVCIGLAFIVQWVAFVPAYIRQTERFFDLTGSLTYVSVVATALLLSPRPDGRSALLFVVVVTWAARLGSHLFQRVRRSGKDARFDAIKPSFIRFLTTWTLQGLWVSLTLAAALAAITSPVRRGLDAFAICGLAVWAFGFSLEVIADHQKNRFRADPANSGEFIRTGLWARSRHPNYFGEITLWIGVAIIALPTLGGWRWLTLISPLFVAFLITRVSGVPILEKRADEKWGGRDDYEDYKRRTPVLIPLPPNPASRGQGSAAKH